MKTGSSGAAVLLLVVVAGGCAPEPVLLTTLPVAANSAATDRPSASTSAPRRTSPAVRSVAAAAGAEATPYPRGRPGTPDGGLPPTSTRTSPNPDVVARAALTVLYGSDTVLDGDPLDAERRALPWLGGPLAAGVRTASVVAAPGAAWNRWAAHHAHLRVRITRGWDDGAPRDGPTAASRQYVLTQTPVGPDGWTGPDVRTVVVLRLTRTGSRWRVTGLLEEG